MAPYATSPSVAHRLRRTRRDGGATECDTPSESCSFGFDGLTAVPIVERWQARVAATMGPDVLCLLRDAASVSFPACVSRLTSMSRYLQVKLMLGNP